MGRFDILTQLDNRPPLSTPKSEITSPASPSERETATGLHANQQTRLQANRQTSKSASMQTGTSANPQAGRHASVHTSKPASQQTPLPANAQTDIPAMIVKYSTYLTPACKKGLQRIAFENDRKDYEVLIEAVEQYLEKQGH